MDSDYLRYLVFNEATFHVIWYANKHSCHVWGSEDATLLWTEKMNATVNVWCGVTFEKVNGLFFFTEDTITYF
jgi:hypothetical protein